MVRSSIPFAVSCFVRPESHVTLFLDAEVVVQTVFVDQELDLLAGIAVGDCLRRFSMLKNWEKDWDVISC